MERSATADGPGSWWRWRRCSLWSPSTSRRASQWAQVSELNRAQLLPTTPARAARALLRAVADDDPTVCATTLSPFAAGQLAAAAGAPDCPAAVHAVASRVVDPRRYATPDGNAVTHTLAPDGQTGTVDACHLTWPGLTGIVHGRAADSACPPGPQLGRLDLVRVLGQGYEVVRFATC